MNVNINCHQILKIFEIRYYTSVYHIYYGHFSVVLVLLYDN